ncbi:2901_t:CDS:2 [Diversispora eburnea]|uniref:2901_t:CDS:1 n=1 Tax=Diversispora eburnea TaxID=1213867 RepID=A0A9N8ZKD5_9GLOM|nr:2901_t:CDS:2 [Diversispora eburnea]
MPLESLENNNRSTTSLDSTTPLLGDERSIDNSCSTSSQGFSGSSLAAYINITCVVAGSGVLGLPYAIKQGGWIGIGLIPLSMLITLYTSVILIKCLYYDGKTRLKTFEDIGYHAFGNFGKYFLVGIFNNIILLGVSILFLILAGQSFDALVEQYWDIQLGVRFCTFIVALSIVDLSNISKSDPPTHDLIVFAEFPIAFATISFSFGANSVFPHIEESMNVRKDWNKVVSAALSTCTTMYMLVAFFGYYVYGNDCLSPIFNNLPKGPFLTMASIFITMHVLLTAPILLTSFSCEAEKGLKITREFHSPLHEFILRAGFRTFIVVTITSIAVIVPFFGDFMSLLGAVAVSLLVFVLPVVFYIRLYGLRTMSTMELLWSFFVIIIGLACCLIGTVDAIAALLKDFRESSN